MNSFTWIEPKDTASAIVAGAKQGALFKAGGVDVTDLMKDHVAQPTTLVNLRRIGELDFLRVEKGVLAIGPLVTLARISEDARVRDNAPALAQAASWAATPQIRNLATLGGNLAQRPRCPYFRSELFHCRRKGGTECFAIPGENQDHAVFDNDLCAIVHPSGTATALVALGASLRLKGPRGERTLPIERFFVKPEQDITRENVLQPGELIVEIRVPAGRRSEYVKLMQKQTFDWPLADAAVAWDGGPMPIRNARVVLGAAAPVPWRAIAVEKALEGKTLDETLAASAARLATQGATPLDKNQHKLPALQAAVLRSLRALGRLA
ncbi:MAG TPA: FAD binding domain-containing protein [Myxococcales bacterium]|nr:FAD binding domain-containing protein [Myxococcales bacterium]